MRERERESTSSYIIRPIIYVNIHIELKNHNLYVLLGFFFFQILFLFGLVLWHINLCRLFNAKSIFM